MRTTRYRYVAKDPEGGLHEDFLEATTRANALSLLAKQNLEVVSLKKAQESGTATDQIMDEAQKSVPLSQQAPDLIAQPKIARLRTLPGFLYSPSALWRRETLPTAQEKVVFLNELAAFVGAGIPLPRALHFLAAPQPYQSNESLRKALQQLQEALSLTGSSIVDAFTQSRLFTALELARVAAAEKNGKLELCLGRLAQDLQSQLKTRQQIHIQLAAPLSVLAITWLLFPLLVRVAAQTSASLGSSYGPILKVLAHPAFTVSLWVLPAGLAWLLVRALRNGLATRLPKVGPLYHRMEVLFSARALSELLDSGVALSEALPLAGSIALKEQHAQALRAVQEEGRPLAESLQPFYPSLLTHMLSAGEQAGAVPQLLQKGVLMLEEECHYQLGLWVQLLEPLLLLGVGLLVGAVCLFSLAPIFSVLENL
ncbi:type II secretion system F family protein [bacterium]|nr:type II secretion system F family protein [bacterium]